jgi:hypothetical protein
MSVKLGRRPRLGPSREALAETRAQLGRWTSLRFDLDKLDPDEQSDLVRLCRQAATGATTQDAWRFDPAQLVERDQRRLEEIVEKAAGREGVFAAEREEKKTAAKIAELACKARRLALSDQDERGFLAELRQQVLDGHFELVHASFLAALVMQFASGEPFSSRAHFEGAGESAWLHVDFNRGLFGGHDPDGIFAARESLLKHLGGYGWLVVERQGKDGRIQLGPRTLAALGRSKP